MQFQEESSLHNFKWFVKKKTVSKNFNLSFNSWKEPEKFYKGYYYGAFDELKLVYKI